MFNQQILLNYKNLVQQIGVACVVTVLSAVIGIIAVFATMHGNSTSTVGPSFLITAVIAAGYALLYMIKLIQAIILLNSEIRQGLDHLKSQYESVNRKDVTDR